VTNRHLAAVARAPLFWLLAFLCCMAEWRLLDVPGPVLAGLWLLSVPVVGWLFGLLLEGVYSRLLLRSRPGYRE
jgi:hypothetical protein